MKYLNEKSNKEYKKLVEQIKNIQNEPYYKISESYGMSASRTSCIINGYKKASEYDIQGAKEFLEMIKFSKDNVKNEKEELQKIKIVIPKNMKFVNGILEVILQ